MPLAPETLALAVLLALAIDHCWGEPPARWHPVVWMGQWLAALGRWAAPAVPAVEAASGGATPAPMPAPSAPPVVHVSPTPRLGPWLRGTAAWWLGAVAVAALAWALQTVALQHLGAWAALALALALKPLLAWRMLRDEVAAVEAALTESMAAGRERLAWLCSRDVSQLSATEVRETALETLAENLCDSVVAPLCWFAVAGLPGAALYRWANTADAMWGYPGARQGRVWTWAGQWAARADDALNWLPARLTGLALMLLAPTPGRHWRGWPAQARRTPSPNGGWPMGALALGLDVRLGKPGVYVLNPMGRAPTPADAARALTVTGRVVVAVAGLALAVLGAWGGAVVVAQWAPHAAAGGLGA